MELSIIKLTENLMESLETEKNLYLCLNDLSSKKSDAIVKRDVSELNKIVEAEQVLLLELGEADRIREECIISIASSLNISQEGLTVSRLTDILNKQDRHIDTGKIKKTAEELKNILLIQKQQNKTNMCLIQNNLDYLNILIKRTVLGDNSEKTYTELGEKRVTQNRNIIDESV